MKQVSSLVVFCILCLATQAQQINLTSVMSDAEKQTELMLKEAANHQESKSPSWFHPERSITEN